MKLDGPLSLEEAATQVACTSLRSIVQEVEPFVARVIAPKTRAFEAREKSLQFCRDALESGEADVWLDQELELSQYMGRPGICAALHLVSSIKLIPYSLAFGLRKENVQTAIHVSRAMLNLDRTGISGRLFDKHFKRSHTCPPFEAESTTPVGFTSMAGLFILFGAFAVPALLAALAHSACKGCKEEQ